MFAFIDRMLGFDACAIYNGYIIINSEVEPRCLFVGGVEYVCKVVCKVCVGCKR